MEEIDNYTDNYTDNFDNGIEEPDYFEEIDFNDYEDPESTSYTSSLFANLFKNSENLGVKEARKLVKSGHIGVLADNLLKFNGLDNDIANKLIQNRYTRNLAKGLISFQNLDKKIAKILAKNLIGAVASNLSSFIKLDDEIAQILIKNNYYNEIAGDIDRFKNLSNETLISLLVNCTKHKRKLIERKSIFPRGGKENKELLSKLKKEGRDIEYKKLKEFYDTIHFEEARKDFKKNNEFDKGFNIYEARKAINYGEGKLIIDNLDKFIGDQFRELMDLLIEGKYIDNIKNILPKLRGKHFNRNELVHQFCLTNNYNVLINNADNLESEGISNIEIAEEIIENCDVDCWDCITKLDDYSDDDEEWEWINYNLDFSRAIRKGKKEDFINSLDYFKSDFSPLPVNRKLPLKLKNIVKEKFGLNTVFIYKDLFKYEK